MDQQRPHIVIVWRDVRVLAGETQCPRVDAQRGVLEELIQNVQGHFFVAYFKDHFWTWRRFRGWKTWRFRLDNGHFSVEECVAEIPLILHGNAQVLDEAVDEVGIHGEFSRGRKMQAVLCLWTGTKTTKRNEIKYESQSINQSRTTLCYFPVASGFCVLLNQSIKDHTLIFSSGFWILCTNEWMNESINQRPQFAIFQWLLDFVCYWINKSINQSNVAVKFINTILWKYETYRWVLNRQCDANWRCRQRSSCFHSAKK